MKEGRRGGSLLTRMVGSNAVGGEARNKRRRLVEKRESATGQIRHVMYSVCFNSKLFKKIDRLIDHLYFRSLDGKFLGSWSRVGHARRCVGARHSRTIPCSQYHNHIFTSP